MKPELTVTQRWSRFYQVLDRELSAWAGKPVEDHHQRFEAMETIGRVARRRLLWMADLATHGGCPDMDSMIASFGASGANLIARCRVIQRRGLVRESEKAGLG